MTSIRELEKIDFEDFEKPKGRELVIIPKQAFIQWYKRTKNIMTDIEMERTVEEYKECPNCRSTMESYDIKSDTDNEHWYFCSECNLTFSEKQHDYFTMMILRLINGE